MRVRETPKPMESATPARTRVAQPDARGGAFNALAYSPDGHLIAAARGDATVMVWEAATGVLRSTVRGHTGEVHGLCFSPDGRRIATAGADMTVRIWDVDSGNELHRLTGHLSQVTSVGFSPDGRWLASGSWDKTVKLWDGPRAAKAYR